MPPSAVRPPARKLRLALLAAIGVIAVLVGVSFLSDEPLRRSMERRMNASLEGYTTHIGRLRFHPIGLALTLENVELRQDSNPEPAILMIPSLHASVQWKELLALRLVADFVIDRPKIYVNLVQLRAENDDAVPVEERGWQRAIEQIYPLKINRVAVRRADVTYFDTDPGHPLRLTSMNLRAENIRNIHSGDRVYPSSIHADAVIFETGKGTIDGHADFLAEPFPGVNADITLSGIRLADLRPVVARSNLELRGGTLSLAGRLEYGPKVQTIDLEDLEVRGIRVDYLHTAATAGAEAARVEKAGKAARAVSRDPETTVHVGHLAIVDADLGYVNRAKDPGYRLFLSDAIVEIRNASSGFRSGEAAVAIHGRFMGKGRAIATGKLRAQSSAGPNFDLSVRIEDTPVTALNDLFRSYGNFDVAAGTFTFYSELSVANGHIEGYVKPLFRDMKVYDRRQDAEKSVFRKLYEKIVNGVSDLLENRRRDEVATKADISGPIENPNTSTVQVILRLIQNAFFRAILPGFEQEVSRANRGR